MDRDRRAEIVAVALDLARESGLRSVSVRNVATRAGIGPSTLRHYFPTQRELIDEVAELLFDLEVDDLRITDRRVRPSRRLTECLAQFLPADDQDRAALQGWLAMTATAYGPDRRQDVEALRTQLERRSRSRLRRWLTVLDDEGVRREGDLGRQTTVLEALIDGLSVQLLAGVSVAEAQAVLREVVAGVVVADP